MTTNYDPSVETDVFTHEGKQYYKFNTANGRGDYHSDSIILYVYPPAIATKYDESASVWGKNPRWSDFEYLADKDEPDEPDEKHHKTRFIHSRNQEDFKRQIVELFDLDINGMNDANSLSYIAWLRNKVGILRVKSNHAELVRYGVKWGITSVGTTADLPRPNIRESVVGALSIYSIGSGIPYMQFAWDSGAETKCVTNIKKGLRELILEKLWSMFEHWSLYAEVHDLVDEEFLSDKFLTNQTQERVRHREWARKTFGNAETNKQETAFQIQRVWQGIDKDFENVSTLSQAKEVCSKYIEGTLGVDWYVQNMFHPTLQYNEYVKSLESMILEKHDHSLEHAGDEQMSISMSRLKPLLKSYPKIANIYSLM